ncbi:MAG: hypothetical protein ABIE70_02415 [bacterium]
MSDLRLYSVNWQDGMLVTQQHLKDQEAYFENLVRWHSLNIGDRYGLIRKDRDGSAALEVSLAVSSGRLQVEVLHCQALTPDGSIIDFRSVDTSPLRAQASVDDGPMAVYIGIDTPDKREAGEPDPQEDPPRYPYLAGNYILTVGEPPSVTRGRYLQIGRLIVDGNDARHDATYYPPMLTISADQRLNERVQDYRNRLENLLSLASRAFTAINLGESMAKEQTSLQEAFKQTIYQFSYHLSATLDNFVIGRNAVHPRQMVIFFKQLFRVFTTALNLQPSLKDYLNEKFFTKELGTEIGSFMSQVDSFLLADYDHDNLGGHIKDIDSIVGALRAMMGYLAQVKHEQLGRQAVATDSVTYRGQTYRVADYGQARLEQLGELSYLVVDMSQPQAMVDTVVLLNKELASAAQWSAMQIRLGLNDARGLGQTDPVEIDATTYDTKVALHPQDMLKSPSVRQLTLIFRGAADPGKFANLGKTDLTVYTVSR